MTTHAWIPITQGTAPLYIGAPYAARYLDGNPVRDPDGAAGLLAHNRHVATTLGTAVRRCGIPAVIQHLESFGCEDSLTEEQWLTHGIELLRVCSGIVVPPWYQRSRGTTVEVDWCRAKGRPVVIALRVSPDPRESIPDLWRRASQGWCPRD